MTPILVATIWKPSIISRCWCHVRVFNTGALCVAAADTLLHWHLRATTFASTQLTSWCVHVNSSTCDMNRIKWNPIWMHCCSSSKWDNNYLCRQHSAMSTLCSHDSLHAAKRNECARRCSSAHTLSRIFTLYGSAGKNNGKYFVLFLEMIFFLELNVGHWRCGVPFSVTFLSFSFSLIFSLIFRNNLSIRLSKNGAKINCKGMVCKAYCLGPRQR